MLKTDSETLPTTAVNDRGAAATRRAAHLCVVLECDRPLAAPTRHSLGGVDTVLVGRGSSRSAARAAAAGGQTLALRIPDARMSSAHLKILYGFGQFVLQDQGSRNGTVVNGVAESGPVRLTDGDLIEVGHTLLVYREQSLPAALTTPLDVEPVAEDALGLATLEPLLELQLALVRELAPTPVSIIVQAETGTGKELVARAIHALSRRPGAFVAVNCGAIPASLVETELFGYRKGAFSGAAEDRTGLIRAADKGTLFLDEIGDLPPGSQAAFLRVLQEREVVPVGATRGVPVDMRVVAATHKDLAELAKTAQFRADLLARISGYTIRLPPLRERRCDLGLLVRTLLARVIEDPTRVTFTPAAARALCRYAWPLNVRELEKALEAAVVLARGGPIDVAQLPEPVRAALDAPYAAAGERAGAGADAAEPTPLTGEDRARRAELVALLRAHGGNVSAVARAMGKARMQIQRWMKRYGL